MSSLGLATRGYYGGVSIGADPVVDFISPTPDTTPGIPGAMPGDYPSARDTPIVLDVTDSQGAGAIKYLAITAVFLDGSAETVYRNGSFAGEYLDLSAQSSITNGLQLTIRREDGWPGARPASSLAVGIIVDVVVTGGAVTTAAAYYQMPLGGPPGRVPSTPPAIVAPSAVDLTAETLPLIVWQFRSA